MPKGTRAVTFQCRKRTADDVSSNSHSEKLPVRLNQRRDSPERDHDEHQRNTYRKLEAPQHLPISRVDDYHSYGQQGCPSHRAFGKKTQCERQVENEPGSGLRAVARSLTARARACRSVRIGIKTVRIQPNAPGS